MGATVASLQTTDTSPIYGVISIADTLSFAGKTTNGNGNAAVFSNVTDTVANYTDANIAAINNLGAQVTGVGFSDTVDNLNTAKTQLLTWMAGLLKSYTLSLNLPDGTVLQSFTTDGQTLTINAANAAGFANKGLNFSLKVQDSTANLNAVNLHTLASLGSQLISLFDTDQINGSGSIITQAISVADVVVLAPKSTDYYNSWGWQTGGPLKFNNVTDSITNIVANASQLSSIAAQITLNINDTAANINANFLKLVGVGSAGLGFTVPDSTALSGHVSLSGSSDGGAWVVNAATAVTASQEGLTLPLRVQDSTANLNAVNLHTLASLGSQLISLFDTDQINGSGSIITQAISVADVVVLAPKSTDYYNSWGWQTGGPLKFNNVIDSITNIVWNASQLKSIAPQITLNIYDTPTNINANYAKLQAIGSAGLGFTIPDSTALSGQVSLSGSSDGGAWVVNAATAITANQDGLTLPIRVQDTTANLNAVSLHALAALGSQLLSIYDPDQTNWSNPISQAINVADVLVLAPKSIGWSVPNGSWVKGPQIFNNVIDTAANIANNANKLSALGTQISINVTDTVANINANQANLSSLANLKTITLPDGTNFQAGFTVNVIDAVKINSHGLTIPWFKVQDSSANLATNWSALAKLGSPLSSVQNTDSGVTALTAAINVADTIILAPKTLNSTGGLMNFANVNDSASNIANNATKLFALSSQLAINVTDTVANINANQAKLLTLGAELKSFNLPDSNVINLNVNASGYYVIAQDAVKLSQEGITFPVNVVDTDANIFANADALAKLGVQIKSITDTSAVNNLPSAINAADAIILASNLVDSSGAKAIFGNVSDSAANVASNLDKLQAIANQFTSIKLTDTGTPTLKITATQLSLGGDAQTLGLISGNYNLAVSGATADNLANTLGNTHVSSIGIVDSASSVAGALDNLQANAAKLSAITFTDSNTPTLAITATQFANDTAAFGLITGQYNIAVSGVSVANLKSTLGSALSVTLKDSAANVVAGLDSIQAQSNKVTDIKLTDIGAPAISVTATQFNNDYKALNLISSNYRLTIQGSIAANLASKLGNSHWAAVAVADSGINVIKNLDALQAHTTNISGINLTDTSTPTLSITAAKLTNNSTALGLISNNYNLAISGVSSANLNTVVANTHVISASVSDSAANIATNLNSLQTNVAKLTSIKLTDTSTPKLAITASQLTNDSAALGLISNKYNLAVGGVSAANVSSVLTKAHVASVSISDTAAATVANLSSLQTNVAKITGISFTDTGTPALNLTAAQWTNAYSALNLISSNYRLTIKGSIAANLASKLGNSHWAAVAVADSGVNISTNLDALQAHTANISGISLTDTSTPTLAITASQLTNDSAALGLISNTYNLAVSGVSAANVSSVLTKAHVASVSISDTAAATVTNLSSLQTNVAKITGITLTDTGTPTLSLTAATVSSAQSVLNDIQTNYLLSVKDTVSNINKLDLSGLHTTSIEIQPTGLVVGQNLQENTKVTNLNLSLINLTGDSINEKVYNTTGTEIDILNSSSAIISKFIFTHDTEAQLHLIGVGSTPVHLI